MSHVTARGAARAHDKSLHELSIAQAILDRVAVEMRRHGGARPSAVGIRLGEISGVDREALAFGFEALVKDTAWEKLLLDVDYCRRRHHCAACAREFAVLDFDTACPYCGALNTALISGDELDIAYIEVEEA
ncbi:MAG: hydrogenase maturation nickel metallochaperone HypA [Acidobacteria bacterium]|nr:hydrogenase maturation nickel metallochaperone HypA [Acidobacteriota bacterium]